MSDTRDLLVRIKGDTGDFEKSMKGVQDNSETSKTSFLKLTGAVAAGQAVFAMTASAIRGTTDFLKSSVKAYEDVQSNYAALEHAVVGVTHATKDQLDATSKLADELSKKGVLDDDNIRLGLAQLSTFGLSNKAVQELGGSLADLAVNQFGVNASGQQLSDTANMIAKALNGQFGILEKSGIRFTQAQKDIIKYGTEMQKVDAINQGFAQNLKFTNEVAMTTTEGKVAHLNVLWGNMKESIGKVTVDALLPFVTKLTNFVSSDRFQAWLSRVLQIINDDIKPAFKWIADVAVPTLIDWGKKAVDLGEKVEQYLKPSFDRLFKTLSEDIFPLLKRLWKEVIEPIIPVIGTLFVGAIVLAVNAFDDLLKFITPVINFMLDNKGVVVAFAAAFGILYAAMKFNDVFNTLTIGFNTFKLVTIPSTIASMEALQAVVAAPMFMGAIAVGAALIAIGAVYDKITQTKKVLDDMNNGIQADTNSDTGAMSQVIANYKAGKITKEQYQSFFQKISGARATGGSVDAGSAYIVGEKGQEVFVPNQSGTIVPNDKLNNMGSNTTVNLEVNIGMYAGMPVEKREIALDMWKEIVRAARANNVQLPMIGAVNVQ